MVDSVQVGSDQVGSAPEEPVQVEEVVYVQECLRQLPQMVVVVMLLEVMDPPQRELVDPTALPIAHHLFTVSKCC